MQYQTALKDHPLIFITDRHRSKGRDNVTIVRAALKGGCRWIQYREPDLDDATFFDECLVIKEMCDAVGAGLIINSRLDVAALTHAAGVHLGKGDLPAKYAREHMGVDFLIGYSAHSIEEAVTAEWEGVNYITYSPMFRLTHKDSPFEPHGIEGTREVLKSVKIPVFFLGGIKIADLEELAAAIQPLRVAGVSMISEADDIESVVEETLHILETAFRQHGSE